MAVQRYAFALMIVAVLAAATGLRITDPQPLASARRVVFDTYLTLAPRVYDPALPVRIIDIDEASLARVGQWPWPRTRMAELIDKLAAAGAGVIAIDFIFPEADRTSPAAILERLPDTADLAAAKAAIAAMPSNDTRLAEAIAGAPVVLGMLGSNENAGRAVDKPRAALAFAGAEPHAFVPSYGDALQSLPTLVEKAAGLGAMNWVPDHDQVVRRLPVLIGVGKPGAAHDQRLLFPSLSVETLRVAQGASTIVVKSSGASGIEAFGEKTGIVSARVGQATLPTDAEGQLALKLTHTDRRRYLSAYKVLDGSAEAALIAGNIVLIGASAPGLMDIRTTPLDRAIPGVEVHAQAIEQMLLGEHLVRPDYATGLELLVLWLAGVALAVVLHRAGAVRGALAGAVAVALTVAVSWLAYRHAGLLLDPVYPALALAAIYSAGTLSRFQSTEAERAQIRAAFSRYMAPAMVEQLAAHPEKLKLGGETRELSLLFADVRGFTQISEGMDAQDLTRFVNRLFTPLANVILENGGTIDKYMGDAVMAFWNAPLDEAEHASKAARSALQMQQALAALNTTWAMEAQAAGRPHRHVAIGIGLNTGPCCVGNLGSEQRFDYSAIGDDVNLASRLEGETKRFGVAIIASERTVAAAPGLAYLPLGEVTVRGRSQPVAIFALLGDERLAATEAFRQISAALARLTTHFAANDLTAATDALAECQRLAFPGLDGLWRHFAKAITATTPPSLSEANAKAGTARP